MDLRKNIRFVSKGSAQLRSLKWGSVSLQAELEMHGEDIGNMTPAVIRLIGNEKL